MAFCCCTFGCFYCKDGYVRDKVAIITGGNTGIGYFTAKALLLKGMKVVIACRSKEKGEKAAKSLSWFGKAIFMQCDLASFESIRNFVKDFKATGMPLHCLVNNAGIMGAPYEKTKDGFESHIGVNHIGHFYLTLLLMDLLKANTPSRIVNVSSIAHLIGGLNFFDQVPYYNEGENYSGMSAYGHSKACNIFFTYELQRRLKGTGVTAVTVHPGVIRTNLWQYLNPYVCCICKCPTDGAKPLIYGATSSNLEQKRFDDTSALLVKPMSMKRTEGEDRYLVPTCCCTSESVTDSPTYKPEAQKQLWDLSLKWTGLDKNEEIIKMMEPIYSKEEESAPFEPTTKQYLYNIIGNSPCFWCCC